MPVLGIWRLGALETWCSGDLVLWRLGALEAWCSGDFWALVLPEHLRCGSRFEFYPST